MKIIFSVLGALIAVAGLIWAAQGAGILPYPATSFMIDNSRWIWIGLATAVVGVIIVILAQRS
jgi:hypothetical protein